MDRRSLYPVLAVTLLSALFTAIPAQAQRLYGESLCEHPHFYCIRAQKGDTWESLWPNEHERAIVKRLNRMNIHLVPHTTLAVPNDLETLSLMDIAPFQHTIEAPGQTLVIFSPQVNAWGAYDAQGHLVNWGPASGGQGWCPDIHKSCRTPAGTYSIQEARGAGCTSSKYPIPYGGAPTPYCMFFHQGYAFHGSFIVPGYNASHGCVRTFVEDARWLREEFIQLPHADNHYRGTKVIVEPYSG